MLPRVCVNLSHVAEVVVIVALCFMLSGCKCENNDGNNNFILTINDVELTTRYKESTPYFQMDVVLSENAVARVQERFAFVRAAPLQTAEFVLMTYTNDNNKPDTDPRVLCSTSINIETETSAPFTSMISCSIGADDLQYGDNLFSYAIVGGSTETETTTAAVGVTPPLLMVAAVNVHVPQVYTAEGSITTSQYALRSTSASDTGTFNAGGAATGGESSGRIDALSIPFQEKFQRLVRYYKLKNKLRTVTVAAVLSSGVWSLRRGLTRVLMRPVKENGGGAAEATAADATNGPNSGGGGGGGSGSGSGTRKWWGASGTAINTRTTTRK